MSKIETEAESAESVLGRLLLAQAILEESDLLEAVTGYDFKKEKWWLHPRHQREALVTYLLLTCFDRLGQSSSFTAFADWLRSNKRSHKLEREQVLSNLQSEATQLDAANALVDRHHALYGVKNAFFRGIEKLTEEERRRLLSSVGLSHSPQYGLHGPNVSTPNFPLDDSDLERSLKLKYLYEKRNQFTHRLEQHLRLSTPLASDINSPSGSAWVAEIEDSRLSYWGVHQDHVPLKTGGAYCYSVSDWPFVLFEALYAAIGIAFDRTSIKLKFKVLLHNSARPDVVGILDPVEHSRLKDFRSLEKNFWTELPVQGKE